MKKKFSLLSLCGDVKLACDECNSMEELKATFIEAHKYYVGRKPKASTIVKFISNGEITANNGLDYHFYY